MEYTENGLRITLEELRSLLETAENEAKYHNMEKALYIKDNGSGEPKIIQYCSYADCNPKDYTYFAKKQ